MARKKIDALVEYAKGFGAKGLAYLAVHEDGSYKCSFGKFMKPEELDALAAAMEAKPGDLLFFAAGKDKMVFDVLGNLRLELARQLGLLDKKDFKFLWVTEFPLLEYSEEEKPLCGDASSLYDADGGGSAAFGYGSRSSTRQGL